MCIRDRAGEGGRIFNVDDSCAADAVITLQNIRLVGNTSGTYTRGVSLYQTNNVTLHLDNVYLSSNYYALNIASENTDFQATIENSTLSGWCALQTWSSGVDVAISNSTLLGTNDKTLGPSNSFSTLVINDGVQDAVIALEGCQVKAVTTTGNRQNIPVSYTHLNSNRSSKGNTAQTNSR